MESETPVTEETTEETFDRTKAIQEIGVKTAKLVSLSCVSFISDVLELIETTGYKLKQSDCFSIALAIKDAEFYFCSKCNRENVPAALITYALQRVVGTFLNSKLQSGSLEIGSIDLSSTILTSIEMGDVKESFDKAGSDRVYFEKAIEHLRNSAEKDGVLKCYTKVRFF